MDGADGTLDRVRQFGQHMLFVVRKNDAPFGHQRSESQRLLDRALRRSGQYQIEVLLTIRPEVSHLMVDAKHQTSGTDVVADERGLSKQVEEDSPTCNLRVVIAPGVILPRLSFSF